MTEAAEAGREGRMDEMDEMERSDVEGTPDRPTEARGRCSRLWSRVRPVVAHPVSALACRVALAGIFLFAGIPKALGAPAFLLAVRAYQIVPNELAPTFALMLPMAEILVGLTLLLGVWVRPSTTAIVAMMLMFMTAIVSVMVRGVYVEDCGCFAGLHRAVGPGLLAQDAAMLLLVVPIYVTKKHLLALWPD